MPSTLEQLSSISHILSAANHRNKNQHRLAKWWKPFSVLRRNIIKLVSELEILLADEERLGKVKKSSREAVERRAAFMVLWVVPKCYLAFSAVVADNQYANLGLMLTGTLARIQKILKMLVKENENGIDIEESHLVGDSIGNESLDFGVVLSREEAEKIAAGLNAKVDEAPDDQESVQSKNLKKRKSGIAEGMSRHKGSESTLLKPTKKKRKKKGGDEFDDLFSSL